MHHFVHPVREHDCTRLAPVPAPPWQAIDLHHYFPLCAVVPGMLVRLGLHSRQGSYLSISHLPVSFISPAFSNILTFLSLACPNFSCMARQLVKVGGGGFLCPLEFLGQLEPLRFAFPERSTHHPLESSPTAVPPFLFLHYLAQS